MLAAAVIVGATAPTLVDHDAFTTHLGGMAEMADESYLTKIVRSDRVTEAPDTRKSVYDAHVSVDTAPTSRRESGPVDTTTRDGRSNSETFTRVRD